MLRTFRRAVRLWLLAACGLSGVSAADEHKDIRILTGWTQANGLIRVDCGEIPIIGGGFGGSVQRCEERLSLYALFNCFPMKREYVEAHCPDRVRLMADVDWSKVAG